MGVRTMAQRERVAAPAIRPVARPPASRARASVAVTGPRGWSQAARAPNAAPHSAETLARHQRLGAGRGLMRWSWCQDPPGGVTAASGRGPIFPLRLGRRAGGRIRLGNDARIRLQAIVDGPGGG